MTKEREFESTLKGMAEAQEFLKGESENTKLLIVFDELVSNVVRCSGAKTFLLTIEHGETLSIKLVVADDGRRFDPTEQKEPDVSLGAEERGVGGLGLLMVRRLCKSFTYRRENNHNIVEVVIES